MKYLILTVLLVGSLLACETRKKDHYSAETFVPTYKLIVPENWTTETFSIPIEFAPSIPYVGIEEVRFAQGWGHSTSEDYWTYSYLWYLDGKVELNAETIKENLEAYYTGLVGRNIERRKIPKEKLFPVKATIEVTKTYEGDLNTYKGSVHMLDYMAQQPIKLNCLVHVRECPGKDNTFVFYEISPREETHPIWNTLNQIWKEFQCDVK